MSLAGNLTRPALAGLLETLRFQCFHLRKTQVFRPFPVRFLRTHFVCPWQESNLRPSGPQPDALSTELQGQYKIIESLLKGKHYCGEGGIPHRSDSEPGRYTQKARTCSLSTRTLRIPPKRKDYINSRRRRDSNPRGLLNPASLAVRCFRPLSHLSVL